MAERKNRKFDEVTSATLFKRFDESQLLAILGLHEFSKFHDDIREKLSQINGLSLLNFGLVHGGPCKIVETETGEKISFSHTIVYGSGGFKVPEMRLVCKTHGSQSTEFVDNGQAKIEVYRLRTFGS